MAADSAENVILQGYAITGATAAEQALITQGYATGEDVPEPSGDDPAPVGDFDAAVTPPLNLDSE